jgi:hypothetical protein
MAFAGRVQVPEAVKICRSTLPMTMASAVVARVCMCSQSLV